jgi:hypothetical protein
MILKTSDGEGGMKHALSESTTVCIADNHVGAGSKPWWILLAQTSNPPPVRTTLPGRHVLLSQDEIRELVLYLLNFGFLEFDAKLRTISIVK